MHQVLKQAFRGCVHIVHSLWDQRFNTSGWKNEGVCLLEGCVYWRIYGMSIIIPLTSRIPREIKIEERFLVRMKNTEKASKNDFFVSFGFQSSRSSGFTWGFGATSLRKKKVTPLRHLLLKMRHPPCKTRVSDRLPSLEHTTPYT